MRRGTSFGPPILLHLLAISVQSMSAQSQGATSPEYDLAAALTSLPSCSRCRRRRIKCDSLLPACANCEKSSEPCEYPDHVLDQPISREHLASLTARYDELMAIKAELSANSSTTFGDTPGSTSSTANAELPWVTASASGTNDESYWGSSSAYTKLGALIRIQSRLPDLPPTTSNILPGLLEALPRAQPGSINLPTLDVSIAMQLLARGDQRYLDYARQYFNASQQEGGLTLAKLPNLERLQCILLISIYHMLSLEQANIWQYLDLANQILIENEPVIREAKQVYLYSTLASLDVDIAAAYGRPAVHRSPNVAPTEEDYEGSSSVAFHIHQLMGIQQRIHSELMTVEPKSNRGDLCAIGSSFRRELSGWIMDWNLAISSPIHDEHKAEWLRLTGAVLYDQSLLHVLEIPEIGSKDVRERRNVAARFIENCHQLFFFDADRGKEEQGRPDRVWIFPFFWTHAHSIFNAALVRMITA
ncbi:hypothetical protein BDV96DRAFT_692949 [Lophiotrema nucula]|uniref:Zn(2)-C6 fungal-type domain-containing protein n=1 Tax=Lophiotrema nucula TaxID=690887 RepID=A0A6A5YLL0_9PLEO|nr:hypothetical protein BDV96DRAFT_692949 [Lophiotrema nucula]